MILAPNYAVNAESISSFFKILPDLDQIFRYEKRTCAAERLETSEIQMLCIKVFAMKYHNLKSTSEFNLILNDSIKTYRVSTTLYVAVISSLSDICKTEESYTGTSCGECSSIYDQKIQIKV